MAIPWTKIRNEWVKGGITQAQLAEKYGCSVKSIQSRAYKEGWSKQKRDIAVKTQEAVTERVARARVNHLEKLIAANEALLDGLMQLTEEIRKNPTSMLMDKSGSLRSAESMARAINAATLTQRDLYKIPNIDQRFAEKKWKRELKDKIRESSEAGSTVWNVRVEDGVPVDE